MVHRDERDWLSVVFKPSLLLWAQGTLSGDQRLPSPSQVTLYRMLSKPFILFLSHERCIITPILQRKKMRVREIPQLPQKAKLAGGGGKLGCKVRYSVFKSRIPHTKTCTRVFMAALLVIAQT